MGREYKYKDEATRVLRALEQDSDDLLAFFCEILILNRALANARASGPLHSLSAVTNRVLAFAQKEFPDHDPVKFYRDMYWIAWEMELPKKYFDYDKALDNMTFS